MHLFLIRHGISEDSASSDEERALTPEGKKGIEKIARHITSLSDRPELLFSSPLLRARQTAQVFGEGWRLKTEIVEWLTPETAPGVVLEQLKNHPETSIALVGHLPNLGYVLGAFLGGLPPREIVIPRGGAALLHLKSWEAGAGKLKWLLTPELLK